MRLLCHTLRIGTDVFNLLATSVPDIGVPLCFLQRGAVVCEAAVQCVEETRGIDSQALLVEKQFQIPADVPASGRFALMHDAASDVDIELLTRAFESQEPSIAIEELAECERAIG